MKKIILSLFVAAIALSSCKKDDKNCDLNATNLVGAYKLTSLKYKADATTPEVDEFILLDACEKDDLFIINANNTVTYQDAGVACTPSTNDTGVWLLTGSTFTLDGSVYNVTSFTCSGITLTQSGTVAGELTTVTLAKQ